MPRNPTLGGFAHIFGQDRFGRFMANSLLVALAVTAAGLFVNSLAGFGFARFHFHVRDPLFAAVLVTFMVPLEIIVNSTLHRRPRLRVDRLLLGARRARHRRCLLDLPAPPVLPGSAELVDAARIDGCGWFAIYWRIALPSSSRPSSPPASSRSSASGTPSSGRWSPSSPEYTVVQVGLAEYITEFVTFWDRLLAGAVAASVPVLVLYFVLQRYYVQGISTTGLKT